MSRILKEQVIVPQKNSKCKQGFDKSLYLSRKEQMKLDKIPDIDVTTEDILSEENVLLLNEGIEKGHEEEKGKEKIPYTPEEKKLIKDRVFESVFNQNIKQAVEKKPLLSDQEVKYLIQYVLRTIEAFGIDGFSINYTGPLEGTIPGKYEKNVFDKANKLAHMLFQNLEEELDILIDEHGETIRDILLAGEKMVFVCTHPSWVTLAMPTFILKKIQKKYNIPCYVEENNGRIILAPTVIMAVKEIGGGEELNVKKFLTGMGLDIIVTTPVNPDREKDPEIKELGDSSRIVAGKKLVNFSEEKGTSLLLAPEGSITPVDEETGRYKLKMAKDGTVGAMHLLGARKNTKENERKHFVLLGMGKEDMEKGEELKPTNIKMKMEILSPEKLRQIAEEEGVQNKNAFATAIMEKLSDLVDGTYEGATASSEERS